MSVLIIRRALPRDEVSIREIAIGAYSVYHDRMDRKPFPMLEDYAARIGAGQAYVLEDGADIQGYIILVSLSHDTLLLDNMGVRPDCQGFGHGRFLVSWAERLGKTTNKKWIVLYTNEAMRENLTWYRRLGYAISGRRVENGYRRIYFRKQL